LIKYGRIKDDLLGIIRFEPWDHLVNCIHAFLRYDEIVILKARQVGLSWLCAGYALWKALFFEGSRVLILSQGQDEATELLNKVRFIYQYLPQELRVPVGKDQESLMTFPCMHSEIKALPSTEKAGHGYSASLVIRDELEYHPYAEKNFLAVAPAIDAGGQMIDLSTVDKTKSDTHFKGRYKAARAQVSDGHAIFIPWFARPVRDPSMTLKEWYEDKILKKYSKTEVEQEYPEEEEQALSVLSSAQFFLSEALQDMQNDCYPAIETRHNNMVKIWKTPVIGRRYLVVTDPSTGQEDPHVSLVLDVDTLEKVADSHGYVPAELVAQIHDEFVRMYNNAYNTYERNAVAGGVVEQKLKELKTPNQYTAKLGKPSQGWWTASNQFSSGRLDMLYRLQMAVRNRQIREHNIEALNDFMWFIQPENEAPRATKNQHDDFVMCWSIALELRRLLPAFTGGFKTVKLRGM